jgi:hypothetical protein
MGNSIKLYLKMYCDAPRKRWTWRKKIKQQTNWIMPKNERMYFENKHKYLTKTTEEIFSTCFNTKCHGLQWPMRRMPFIQLCSWANDRLYRSIRCFSSHHVTAHTKLNICHRIIVSHSLSTVTWGYCCKELSTHYSWQATVF